MLLRSTQSLVVTAASLLAALSLSACSGGSSGSSNSAAGLSIADQMSVITVQEQGAPAGGVAPRATADTSAFPDDCDYNRDSTRFHVYDPSMEALSTVNDILCMLDQTAYAELVNEPAYKAQVNETACDKGSGGGGTGQSSGQDQRLMTWYLRSTRASDSADHIVRAWVTGVEEGLIHALMNVSEGVSDDNPFGVFNLNFAGAPVGGSVADVVMIGNLRTLDAAEGFVGFSLFERRGDPTVAQEPGDDAHEIAANVSMLADQTSGLAQIQLLERWNQGEGDSGPMGGTYLIAYDETHMLRSLDGEAETCLSRVDFLSRVWDYNLYDATGTNAGRRVQRNSGFSFRTEDGEYGWIGYHGLWAPPSVTLQTGDTVTRQQHNGGTPQTYTLLMSPGKLIKNTRNTLALANLSGEVFEWWQWDGQGGSLRCQVAWSASDWVKTAEWDEATSSFIDLDVPEVIDTSVLGYLGMWSPTLGGSVSYVHGSDSVTYYQQEFVTQASTLFDGSTTVDFYGYYDCLRSGITTEQASSGNVYLTPSNDVAAPHHYRFKKSDLKLYLVDPDTEAETVVGLADGATINGGPFSWGLRTGALVTSTVGLDNTWSVWNSDVFYSYETGPNNWNQYAGLRTLAGTPVTFDPPLQFTYVHSTEDDINGDGSYDGRRFLLSYYGGGSLQGFPHVPVDLNDDGLTDRWYPGLGVKAGTLMGPTGSEYVVRPIGGERTLLVDPEGCGSLNLDAALDLTVPSEDDFTMPPIAPPPNVTGPPRVVQGEVDGG